MVQAVNVTVDDYSPVIEYSPPGAWTDGSPADDPFWESYTNNGTFTKTTVFGASATFNFNGTAIWILGAKRSNHGPYNITLDGMPYQDDGFHNGQIFQQVLFASTGLDGTIPHTVSIINSPTDITKPFLDIDSIVYQIEIPDDYQFVTQQDTDGDFQYSESGWDTDPGGGCDDGTAHSTSLGGAYVDYTFQGPQVELNGVVGPNGGVFTVQLDDGPEVTLNASRTKWAPQTVLYQQSGLSQENHTLRVTNSPYTGQTLTVDFAMFIGASNSTSSSPPASSTQSSSSSLSGGVIGGIVAGISGLLIVTMVLLLLWYRRRHRPPTVRPHDVLHAEFSSENGDSEEAGNSSTLLTPYLESTITRYRVASPPIPVPPPVARPGNNFPALSGPELYQSSHPSQPQPQPPLQFPRLQSQPQPQPQFQPQPVPGPPPGMRLVVRNADGGGTNGRGRLNSAADEKRRLAVAMRERDNLSQEYDQSGPGTHEGPLVPLRYRR